MPNRIIKESVCTSESVNKMTWFEECFFTRLWTACDDYGRFDARTAILKSRLFPLRKVPAVQIENALRRLEELGCIRCYTADGKPFLFLPNWEKHQRIRNQKSKYPPPPGGELPDVDGRPRSTDSGPPSAAAGIQSESKSKSESESKAGEARLPHGKYGWVLLTDAEYGELVQELGKEETDRCAAYVDECAEQTGNKNRWKNWSVTLRKCSRERWGLPDGKRGSVPPPSPPQGPTRADIERMKKTLAAMK